MSQKESSQKKQRSDFAKYGSMATYMGVIVTAGALGGRWLDKNFPISEKIPVYTLVLSLVGVGAAMWYFIRDFIKKK